MLFRCTPMRFRTRVYSSLESSHAVVSRHGILHDGAQARLIRNESVRVQHNLVEIPVPVLANSHR